MGGQKFVGALRAQRRSGRFAATLLLLVAFVTGGVASGIPALAVGPIDPATSTITASPTTITGNSSSCTTDCGSKHSTITVQAKDSSGTNLTNGGATVQLFTTTGSLTVVTDNGNGTYTAVLSSPSNAPPPTSATISGKINGTFMTDDATVTIEEISDVTKSTIASSPASITANGTSTSTITVQAKKADGTNKVAGGEVVRLSTDKGTFPSCTTDCVATDNGNGTYSLVLTSSQTAGTATITGKIHNDAITTASATVQFTPGAADATKTTIEASPTAIAADNTATSTITVTARDQFNNALTTGGATVTVSTDKGHFASNCTSNCPATDAGNGTYTASLSSAQTGTAHITGKINTVAISDTDTTVSFGAGAASPTTTTITSNKPSIPVNGEATITVQTKDAGGNNLSTGGDTVTLTTTLGSLSAVTDNGNGTYTATLSAGAVPGTATIRGTLRPGGAGLPMLITDSETVTVHDAASPTQSTIAASPTSIIANGTSTSVVTFQAKNALGQNITAGGDEITFSTTGGKFPNNCTSNCAATDNNNGTYTLTLTSSTVAGSVMISATANGSAVTPTATVTFTPGPASTATSLITASPTSIPANGTSTSTITVTLKDQFGNALTAGGDAVTLLTSAGSLSTVTDNGNGTYSSTLTSSSEAALATVIGKIGSSFISDDAQVAFIGVPNASQTTISSSKASMPADGSSTATITVQAKDAAGNNLSTGGATVVLSTTLGTFPSACATNCPATDNGDGTYTLTLTSGATPGTASITGKINTVTIGHPTSVIFEGPADPATSQISASPTNIQANGTSTSTVTVQLKDANSNNRTTGGDTVLLSTTLGTFPSSCSSDCVPTDNGNGTYTLTLTSGVTAGTATITGKVGGVTIADNATVAFREVADKTTSTIDASPTQISANGSSTSAITVQLKTAGNANVTSGGDSVTLTTNRGTLSAVTDNGDGTYSATLTSSVSSGIATISGTLNSVAMDDTATVTFVAPPSGSTTSITANPTAIAADGITTSTITVQAKDAGGNNVPIGGATVTLSTNRGKFPGNCTATCAATDNSNGTYTLTLTSAVSSTNVVAHITGIINGGAISDDANVSFTAPSSPSQTTITANPTNIAATGSTTSTITVQAKDSSGANRATGGETVVLTSTAGSFPGCATPPRTNCPATDNGDGTYTLVLTSSSTSGTATITGTLNGSAITDNATVTFTPGDPDVSKSTITASPTSIVANGQSTSAITVQLKDSSDNNLTASGGTVALQTTAGSLGNVTDNNDGTYSATLTSSSTAGSAVVSGTLDGTPITDTETVSFVPGPPSPATTQISAAPGSIVANGSSTSTITVLAKDAANNNETTGGATVTLATTLGSIGAVTDNGDGTYTATLTSSTTTGTATVTGTINGSAIADSAQVQFTPGSASAVASQITANPTTVPANGSSTSTITVQLKDANGNNLTSGGDTVALSTDQGALGSVTDNGDGTYTSTFTSAASAGTALITGTLNSVAMSDTATVVMTGVASANESVMSASPTSIPADGSSASAISVVLKDSAGNTLSTGGDTVTVSASDGSFVGCATPPRTNCPTTDNGDGTYTAILTSSTSAGSAVITGKVNTVQIVDDATVDFRDVPSATTSLITASPTQIAPNGTSTSTITVQLKKSNGSNLTLGGDTVALATNRGSLGTVTDNDDGTYTATLTSSTSPGVATITGTVNGSAITDTATVNFKSPPEVAIFTPETLDDIGIAFFCEDGSLPDNCDSDPVHNITTSNVVMRLSPTGSNIPIDLLCLDFNGDEVDCSTGAVFAALVIPQDFLIAGQHYYIIVNPTGVAGTVKDGLNTTVATTSQFFRASQVEQENSFGSTQFWAYRNNASAFGGSYRLEHIPNATSTFAFTAGAPTTVTWYTITGPNQGLATVYIDDEPVASINNYATSTHYKVARSFAVDAGDHEIKVLVRGAKGSSAATGTEIVVDAFKVGGTTFQTPTVFETLSSVPNPSAFGGRYSRADLGGAAWTFKFRGTGVDWYTVFGPSQGKAAVYIDNKLKGTFDNYRAGTSFWRYRFLGLSDGVHTIKVVTLRQKNASSKDYSVAVDRWVVQ